MEFGIDALAESRLNGGGDSHVSYLISDLLFGVGHTLLLRLKFESRSVESFDCQLHLHENSMSKQ